MSPAAKPDRQMKERRRRYRSGHMSELAAAAFLILKGYRILARRYRTSSGEIDLIATRGRRLAFIEVKKRKTLGQAHDAITEHQSRRIRDACDLWLSRNHRYHDHEICFDVIFLLPRALPKHLENAL